MGGLDSRLKPIQRPRDDLLIIINYSELIHLALLNKGAANMSSPGLIGTADQTMKLFAVVVATQPNYYEYKKAHPEHDQNQLSWFKEQARNGALLCCGPFCPHDGTGLWIIQAENLEAARMIVASSPRSKDGMLSDQARVVEWEAHIGRDRFQ